MIKEYKIIYYTVYDNKRKKPIELLDNLEKGYKIISSSVVDRIIIFVLEKNNLKVVN